MCQLIFQPSLFLLIFPLPLDVLSHIGVNILVEHHDIGLMLHFVTITCKLDEFSWISAVNRVFWHVGSRWDIRVIKDGDIVSDDYVITLKYSQKIFFWIFLSGKLGKKVKKVIFGWAKFTMTQLRPILTHLPILVALTILSFPITV